MRPKILVLGAGGMLGHKIFQHSLDLLPGTIGLTRNPIPVPGLAGRVISGVDAADFAQLATVIRAIRPDFLINCVGVTKQRAEAADPITALTINALLPHRLAALTAEWSGRLIHFSTDCVFSGKGGCYREDDESDACDLYGRTKFLGETQAPHTLTLRTSIIGRELSGRRSLLEWLLSRKGRSVKGFRRVQWSGVTTNHLAQLVLDIVQHHSELSGLYQVAGHPISKHDLLCKLRTAYELPVDIVPDDADFSDRTLDGGKLQREIDYAAPSWNELVTELSTDPTPYESYLRQ